MQLQKRVIVMLHFRKWWNEIFGTDGDQVNLRSQFKACSFDKLDFVPANEKSITGVVVSNGVISIEIPDIILNAERRNIYRAAKWKAASVLGDLSSQYNHVMFCLPPGTAGDWAAFVYIDSYVSVYNDDMCSHPTVQMHEIGHNLGLAHAHGC